VVLDLEHISKYMEEEILWKRLIASFAWRIQRVTELLVVVK